MRSSLILLLAFASACAPSFGDGSGGDLPIQPAGGSGPDNDGDGYTTTFDCDDADPDINPGETEMCADGIDNDCDDLIDDEDGDAARGDFCYDGDGDGWCQDTNGDGEIEIVFLCDADDQSAATIAAQTGGNAELVANYIEVMYGEFPDYDLPSPDCDDATSSVNPGADEVCDDADLDEDCDGYANELDPDDTVSASSIWYADNDYDGYGSPAVTTEACEQPDGYVDNADDCDDDNVGVNPGATEACDDADLDEDCDGAADDADPEGAAGMSEWYDDADGDGHGDAAVIETVCDQPEDYVAEADDCDDTDSGNYPGNAEVCDGADNDCDGTADNDPIDETTWFRDADTDGYGDESTTNVSCSSPTGWTATGGDCDDGDDAVSPAATETYNGIDDDCDGSVDNGATCSVAIQILEDGGEASSLTIVVSDDPSLSGEAYPTGIDGVTVTPTSLGGADWEYIVALDLCVSASGSIVIDGSFASGESLADDPVANVFAWMDSTALTVATYDNGDGTYGYVITR